jgi:glucose-6-phosphate 1-dehydrogenase
MRTTFLIFGLTGDLMKKKGIPALFALWEQKKLPEDFGIMGISRKIWTKELIQAHVKEAVGSTKSQDSVKTFSELIEIIQGESDLGQYYFDIRDKIKDSKLFIYICISPELYTKTIGNLYDAEILDKAHGLLIEKPFGISGEDAEHLQKVIAARNFPEEKIYRIDHFLAKEAMSELSSFAPDEVTAIEVYLNEAFGVESRGAMYDPVGALRDVGQNHLLESAATVLGDRITALNALHILTKEEIKTHTLRAQYEGYGEIPGVKAGSDTETYFRIESWFEMPGKKIPLILESGKLVPNRREVVVTLLNGEKVVPFEAGINEYEVLLSNAFAGDRSRFVSMQEVEALWRFTDPIEKEWHAKAVPLLSYKSGEMPKL